MDEPHDDSKERKRRWREIELKMKFQTCEEATTFWEDDWVECPVCLAKLEFDNPMWDDTLALVHKDRKSITH